MSWLVPLGLAMLAFCLLAFAFRLPRALWSVTGSVLMLGLAGYAWQGSPGSTGVPAANIAANQQTGEQLVALRREVMAERNWSNQSRLITADAMARRSRFADAALLYGAMTRENANDIEAWLALGNALLAQADGVLTPAAQLAFRRAEALAPDGPGVPFFLGMAAMRAGDFANGREAWVLSLSRMQEGTQSHTLLSERVARLDEMLQPDLPSSPSGR